VARSLAIEYTHDPRIYAPAYQHQYLFGPYLLVAPAASTDAFIRLYLPEGRWYDLYTDEILEGERELIREAPLAKPPLFVRAGAVVPMQAPVCCTAQVPEGPLELHIYAGGDDRGGFTYYEDDGVSFDYQEGAFLRRRIRLSDGHLILEKADGGFSSGFERIKFFFHGFGFDEHSRLRVNGEEYVLQSERLRFFAPLTPLGIREMDDPYGELQVHTAEVDHLSKAMHVNLPSSS
jgi:alpha-glucosidase